MFKAARSLQNGANLPRLEVKFSAAKENLFVSPSTLQGSTSLEGTRGETGMRRSMTARALTSTPSTCSTTCAEPGYSTQARLNNPPVWTQGPDGKQSVAASAVGNAYRFAVPSPKKQTPPVMARPCCPFADGYNKCCKKASGGTSGETEDTFRQFWDCSTQHVCDNSKGYDDGTIGAHQ